MPRHYFLSTFFLILTALSAINCKTKTNDKPTEKQLADFRTHFLARRSAIDSSSVLDSFRFVRLDTVTALDRVREQAQIKADRLHEINDQLDKALASAHNNVDIAKLYARLDRTMFENYRDEAQHDKVLADTLNAQADLLMKEINGLVGKFNTTDSIRAIGFEAICFYQTHQKDLTVSRDTAFIFLNINKDIVKREELLKE